MHPANGHGRSSLTDDTETRQNARQQTEPLANGSGRVARRLGALRGRDRLRSEWLDGAAMPLGIAVDLRLAAGLAGHDAVALRAPQHAIEARRLRPYASVTWPRSNEMVPRISRTHLFLAVRSSLWLCMLPLILRVRPLSDLLESLSEGPVRPANNDARQLDRTAEIIARICQLRPFRSRFFPKTCLRQSLTLYRELVAMGYPTEIHFGVRKEGQTLMGHSWVTVDGVPVAESGQTSDFRIVYSYPADSRRAARSETSDLDTLFGQPRN